MPVCEDLRERFVLVYTGQRRLAKGILRTIMGRCMSRDPVVVGILREIQDIARTMRDALLEGDLDSFGELMTRHWEANKVMDPGSTNPFLDQLFEQFTPYIVGGKLVGAGGGGFAEVIVKDRGPHGSYLRYWAVRTLRAMCGCGHVGLWRGGSSWRKSRDMDDVSVQTR